jgi:hypothetical protein
MAEEIIIRNGNIHAAANEAWRRYFAQWQNVIDNTLRLSNANDDERQEIKKQYRKIENETKRILKQRGIPCLKVTCAQYALKIAKDFTPRIIVNKVMERARGDNLTIAETQGDLVKSMLPKPLLERRWGKLKDADIEDFYRRIKWRLQETLKSQLDFAAFENVPTDTRLSDDLSIIQNERQATQSGNGSTRAVENGASNKPYLSGLNPEQIKADAREYMARLVCYVWCVIPEHKSKDRACDYVFLSAKDGDRLYGDCNRARNLLQAYNYNPNTIKTEAAKLHAKLGAWRKKTGLEWPDNWRDMVKESKAQEAKSVKQRIGRN